LNFTEIYSILLLLIKNEYHTNCWTLVYEKSEMDRISAKGTSWLFMLIKLVLMKENYDKRTFWITLIQTIYIILILFFNENRIK